MTDAGVRIRLLGGVVAASDDDQSLDVGSAKCQAVLAALAFSAGSTVPQWQLVESVWGDEPPRTAERTLQSYIARLRKSLGPGTISRVGGGYRLDVPADGVDVLRFEHHLEAGNVEEALREWTGTPLAGLDAPGLDTTVIGLTERWLGAVETAIERRIEVDPAIEIAGLRELTATYPFREGLWALLMTALYRVGRQADALEAYRIARTQLVDQLGVEPGRRLQELEIQILRHDTHLEASVLQPVAPLPQGTLTFAFVEVDEASRHWAESRAAMAEAVPRFHEIVQTSATRHHAHIFSRVGDSLGLVFHRAASAAEWATGVHAAISSEPWPEGILLGARVGLHTGEAEEFDGSYFGPAVNVAARLAAVGHGGQTLLSSTAAQLLEGPPVRELGRFRLDGVAGEQQVFQLGHERHPPVRLEDLHRGNLPRRLGRLIGRDEELATTADAVELFPVVTLIGPGGIGKTRLALAVAQQAAIGDDGWLVELAEVDSSQQVARAVADTLGIAEQRGAGLVHAIVETLRSRHALIVLDNCEHVVEGAAEVAEALASGCDHVRVVATSRDRLGVPNERVVTVPPLDTGGPAMELFDERAAAVSVAYDADADRGAIEEVCRRLDGIPLAIELAAARTVSLGPADLVDRLEHRLRLLDSTRRSSADRHRTMRSAIQWSYDLLSAAERDVFRRLSIFTGPFSLAAAEHVAVPPVDGDELEALLTRLVEQSILGVESGPFGRRFRILQPIREFGIDLLDDDSRRDLAERHAEWCLSELDDIHRMLSGWDEIEGVTRLDELWPNLRSAFDRACDAGRLDVARRLLRPILSEIVLRSNYEIGDWIETLLGVTPPDDEDGLVFGMYWAAHRYSVSQDPAGYERLVERFGEPDHVLMRHGRATATADYGAMAEWAPRAVEALRRSRHDHLAERAEINVATAWLNLGRFEECDERLQQLLARYREHGPPTFVNWTLLLLGYSASFQGAQDRADAYFEEAVGIELPPGTHTPNQPLEARAAFRRGNHIRAFRILEAHIDELLATDNMQASGIGCIEFINMMTAVGRHTEAARMLAYLETTGLLDAPAWRTLIDASAATLSSGSAAAGTPCETVVTDDREALRYMRGVLDQLTEDPTGTG